MNLTKFLTLLILQIMAGTCFAGLTIDTSDQEKTSKLVKAVVKILTNCYEPGAMGIAGKPPDSLVVSLSSEGPVVIIDDSTRSVDIGPVTPDIQHKLHLFVVTASSSMELEGSLAQIKNTRWWNHMAHFYILDWPITENGCSKAHEYLWTAWDKNVLDAKFVCTDKTNGLMIYTFNPYTKDAPKPWKLVMTRKGYNDHPWTMLMRKYREDRETCENMNFDRTKNLGGYPIRVLIVRASWDNQITDYVPLEHEKVLKHFYSKLFSSLNVTPIYTDVFDEHNVAKHREISMKMGNDERYDVELISRDQLNSKNPTYPHYEYGLRVVTNYRGDESQLEKFLHVTDFTTRICMCLVGLVTLIFFIFFLRQTPGIAALNLIRMICNGAFTNLRNDTASRIFIACLLIFVVTIQGIYQGQWAALLAKRKPLKDIDTMKELVESNCTIYVASSYRRYFDGPVFEGRVIIFEDGAFGSHTCEYYLSEDPSAACVDAEIWSFVDGADSKLHVSSERIVKIYLTMSLRDDWPLEERFNLNIQRLVEAGIFQHLYGPVVTDEKLKVEAEKNKNTERVVKVLTLKDLDFAFAILGIGLGCALICFIVELTMTRRGRRDIVKMSRSIRNRASVSWQSCGMRFKNISSGIRDFFKPFFSLLLKIIIYGKPKRRVPRNPERNRILKILRRMKYDNE